MRCGYIGRKMSAYFSTWSAKRPGRTTITLYPRSSSASRSSRSRSAGLIGGIELENGIRPGITLRGAVPHVVVDAGIVDMDESLEVVTALADHAIPKIKDVEGHTFLYPSFLFTPGDTSAGAVPTGSGTASPGIRGLDTPCLSPRLFRPTLPSTPLAISSCAGSHPPALGGAQLVRPELRRRRPLEIQLDTSRPEDGSILC